MSDKKSITPEERDEFRREMHNLHKRTNSSATKPSPPFSDENTASNLPSMASLMDKLCDNDGCLGPDDIISFNRVGVQSNQLRRLKQGKLTITAKLDLHHCTLDQAEDKLIEFIANCQRQGARVVLVVHGKGIKKGARLKSGVNCWLREHPDVLAFHSAQRQHGGTGAIYLLLKTRG